MQPRFWSHPILSCVEASTWEKQILGDDPVAGVDAMRRAGLAVAKAVKLDFQEIGPWPERPRILVLAGKGFNAGDALIAAHALVKSCQKAEVAVVHVFPETAWKPPLLPWVRRLDECASSGIVVKRIILRGGESRVAVTALLHELGGRGGFDVCLDGLLGMHFRAPLAPDWVALLEAVNAYPLIRLRAAVDLPSGVGGDTTGGPAFEADFTYATGIVKAPLFDRSNRPFAGRIRYADIGFFDSGEASTPAEAARILLPRGLAPLRGLRSASADKRTLGHLFILAGSRSMPGALQMNVRAALQAGLGLLTVFAPESVVAPLSAVIPEAMWVPWPETPQGGLSLEGRHLLVERVTRGDALLCGSGMGREAETRALIDDIVQLWDKPLVLDADALHAGLLAVIERRAGGHGGVILTPHYGEYRRLYDLGEDEDPVEYLTQQTLPENLTLVLKGAPTWIRKAGGRYASPYGGPVLARGGSGDLLAGMTGALLAMYPADPLQAARIACLWHGLAADHLARRQGPTAVRTTDLLQHLGPVLRADDDLLC